MKKCFSHRAQLGKTFTLFISTLHMQTKGISRNKKSRSKLIRGQKRKIEFRKIFSKRNPKHLSKYQILTNNRYQPHGAWLNSSSCFSESGGCCSKSNDESKMGNFMNVPSGYSWMTSVKSSFDRQNKSYFTQFRLKWLSFSNWWQNFWISDLILNLISEKMTAQNVINPV